MGKSKKHDDRLSERSSFHLSIDNFSTFSELRNNKEEKDAMQQKSRIVKKMTKEKGSKI